jgi:hypothetical protein
MKHKFQSSDDESLQSLYIIAAGMLGTGILPCKYGPCSATSVDARFTTNEISTSHHPGKSLSVSWKASGKEECSFGAPSD